MASHFYVHVLRKLIHAIRITNTYKSTEVNEKPSGAIQDMCANICMCNEGLYDKITITIVPS